MVFVSITQPPDSSEGFFFEKDFDEITTTLTVNKQKPRVNNGQLLNEEQKDEGSVATKV